jgi:hypothetical protein
MKKLLSDYESEKFISYITRRINENILNKKYAVFPDSDEKYSLTLERSPERSSAIPQPHYERISFKLRAIGTFDMPGNKDLLMLKITNMLDAVAFLEFDDIRYRSLFNSVSLTESVILFVCTFQMENVLDVLRGIHQLNTEEELDVEKAFDSFTDLDF